MKKKYIISFIFILFSLYFVHSQGTTGIPDANFEKALIDLGIDSDGTINQSVLTSDISSVSNLNIYNKNISNLTGIEGFTSLITLNCSSNFLTSLNVSNNSFLEKLYCQNNKIENLDVTSNASLMELDFSSNLISSITLTNNTLLLSLKGLNNLLTSLVVTSNTSLEELNVSGNQLQELIISNNTSLKYLLCSSNQITGLNVSSNSLLNTLDCSSNQLSALVVSANTNLKKLTCSDNQLSEIIVSNNNILNFLSVANNQLTALDVTANLELQTLICADNFLSTLTISGTNNNAKLKVIDVSRNLLSNLDLSKIGTFQCPVPPVNGEFCIENISINVSGNQLIALNIKNGFNTNISLFNAQNNPNLYCIQVDDAFFPNGGLTGWLKDTLAFYNSTTCENLTYVPDAVFETYLEANAMGDGVANNNFVLTSNIESVTSLNVNGLAIANLTGIEDFIALQNLNCSNTNITSIDISKNSALTILTCNNNSLLTDLDLRSNTSLTTIDCYNNALTNLKLGSNSVLTTLNCSDNFLTNLDVSKNTAITSIDCSNNTLSNLNLVGNSVLTTLNCFNNALTSLNLGSNTALTIVNCSNNLLTSLNLGSNNVLTTLDCSSNSLVSLNMSKNLGVTTVNCSNNTLTSLNLGSNTVLKTLDCSVNSLVSLNVSENTALTEIYCSNNLLTSLNLNNNTALEIVDCSNNALTSLDFSNNTVLTTLNLASNSLLKLNLKNGNNIAITSFNVTSNPNVSCIDVDDDVWSTTNWTNIDVTSSFSTNCNTTYIPDANFETYLESHDIDGEMDGENPAKAGIWVSMGDGIMNNFVPTDKISSVTVLDVNTESITDLTGIEDFIALLDLNCSTNSIVSLDLSGNTALTTLDCSTNSLVSLNISNNVAIITNTSGTIYFDATTNPSLSCINVHSSVVIETDGSVNGWLKDATASYNLNCNTTYVPDTAFEAYLETHDKDGVVVPLGDPTSMGDGINNNNFVSTDKISNVTVLDISSQSISNLTGIEDFSSLQNLNCATNLLIDLDLSSNTALTTLNCSINQINSLNISGITALVSIDCSNNVLTSLDFSGAINLTSLTCNDNTLTSLTIKNGQNGILTVFDTTSNPDLYCIEVDDPILAYAATGWQKDAFALYSAVNCANRITVLVDPAFEQALINLGYDSIEDLTVLTANIEGITSLDISLNNIFDLTGIEDFRSLNELNCSDNYISNLNVQSNTALTVLNCGGNNLTSLDISKNILLERLNCNSNNLSLLDATTNISLQKLVCANNKLTNLVGVSGNPYLTDLDFSNNNISNVIITGDVSLEKLKGSKNNLTVLNTIDNTNLVELIISSNRISSLDLSTNTLLHKLNGSLNKLESLTLTSNTALDTLNISGNKIASIVLAANTNLISLDISKNVLTSLSLTTNNLLKDLNISSNLLETLVLTNNTLLKDLNLASNQFLGIDVASLSSLLKFNCSSNKITALDLNTNSALTNINCSNNQLVTLSLRDWTNNNLVEFNALSNADLTCIEINNIGSIGGSWSKDTDASYSVDCRYSDTYVPDDAFEQALINGGYDTVLDNYVLTAGINTLTTLNISGLSIADLTGIEDFTALQNLDCSGNLLTDLVLSSNTALTTLTCSDNNLLTSLTLVNNTALTTLTCNNNALLTILDLSSNTALTTLTCSNNASLASLNLGSNSSLISLECANNVLTNLDLVTSIALTTLDCSNNSLTNLDLVTNTALITLNCATNVLTSLDLVTNTVLTTLNCSANQIETLDISNNSGLTSLICNNNLLTTLNGKNGNNAILTAFNASSNPNLYCIEVDAGFAPAGGFGWQKDGLASYAEDCRYNETDVPDANFEAYLETHDKYGDIVAIGDLTSLGDGIVANHIVFTNRVLNVEGLNISGLGITDLTGIEDFLNLADLDCSNNSLTSLDVQTNILLTTLNCSVNQIESLDLSSNSALASLFCNGNLLTILSIKNGQNGILNVLNTTSNPYLYCIEVDAGFAPNGALNGWQKDIFASYTVNCTYYETYVPDDNFETYLESLGLGDGIANNDIVLTNLVNDVVILDISGLGIIDLTGIEDFIKLEELDCTSNLLTDLVLERNKDLTTLNCNNNSVLANINLINNSNLTTLNIAGNNISTINLETNTKLVSLDISNNVLASLSLYDNNLIENLNISTNLLNSIDLSSNLALTTLICNNNDFSNLELTNNTAIVELNIAANQFSSIDLTKLMNLAIINGSSNMIIDLNLTLNTLLTDVNFNSNELNTFNIKNGTNTNIVAFDVLNNPNLTCIEVDDPAFANGAAGWLKEASSEYLIECHYGEFFVPDDAFEQALIYLGFDSGPLDDYVPNGTINLVTNLTLNNNVITDLTGIAQFESLVNLDIRNNNLSTLDLSDNLLLETLKCSGNQLLSIDVSANTQLRILNISDNILESLNVIANSNLNELDCSYNQLISLEVNSTLGILDCSHNQLTDLDVSNTTNLTDLNSSFNQLINFNLKNGNNPSLLNLDIQNNPDLWCVLVDDISAARNYITWLKDSTALYKLECVDNDDDGVPNDIDECPTTPFGEPVDLFGCTYFALPASNFTVQITGESCITSNNGKINVVAEETLNYTATVVGKSLIFMNTYKFTKDVNIFNLRSGAYELCITIDDEPSYRICYDINISEPQEFFVSSKVSHSEKKVSLELSGGTTYTINFNGLIFNTTESELSLSLSDGANEIEVKTDLECQGAHKESIFLSNDVFIYPNPFQDFINVFTGNNETEKFDINIYSYVGQLVLSKPQSVKKDVVTLDTSNLPTGIYFVSLKSSNSLLTFKVIKK